MGHAFDGGHFFEIVPRAKIPLMEDILLMGDILLKLYIVLSMGNILLMGDMLQAFDGGHAFEIVHRYVFHKIFFLVGVLHRTWISCSFSIIFFLLFLTIR